MSNTKNDTAWEQLFKEYEILSAIQHQGSFEISAAQINRIREARLMTKFDHKANLPKIFLDNDLSILPITRGSYVISQFDTYKNFEEINAEVTKVSFPEYLESIDYENISSESMAINCAFVSGIIADFTQDEELRPTVSGRMSSNSFSFTIKNIISQQCMPLKVINSQIEIDGGYEGLEYLTLIEAKNSISDDFLVRQLYYPYRLWSENISKPVKPVFLVYSNGIYDLREYVFEDLNSYNSLVLVKQKLYSIEMVAISLHEIFQVLERIQEINEPAVAFPQADNFKRIINLCELLYQNEMTRDDLTTNYDFDPRQTNYYTDAARYLGLVDKKRENGGVVFFLSNEGERLFKLKHKARQLKLVELILKHKPFADTLRLCVSKGCMPAKGETIEIMKKSGLYKVESESTYKRRASTISGWINWILALQQ